MLIIRTSLVLVFHTHHRTCIITLAYFDTCILSTWMLALFHLHWGTYSVHVVVQVWWKCQCVSVSVEVSVFKGFSGRTLRNALGKNEEAGWGRGSRAFNLIAAASHEAEEL